MINPIEEYKEYTKQDPHRLELYRLLAKSYNIKRALYPGSHIDISPSLVIRDVTYVDNFKGAIKFFSNMSIIKDFVDKNKEYKEESSIDFIGHSYNDELEIERVDMIISQYAGFVGQACKKYLKKGGILLANDSHGDASLAFLDDDFELIAVIEYDNTIITNDLDKYFTFARKREIDVEKIYEKMKGPKYKLNPSNYLFRMK